MSHVTGPSRGRVCGQVPEPDGVHPIGPRSANEYQPGERRHTQQGTPYEHLHQTVGVTDNPTTRFDPFRRRTRHDHPYEATGSDDRSDFAPIPPGQNPVAWRSETGGGSSPEMRVTDLPPSSIWRNRTLQ